MNTKINTEVINAPHASEVVIARENPEPTITGDLSPRKTEVKKKGTTEVINAPKAKKIVVSAAVNAKVKDETKGKGSQRGRKPRQFNYPSKPFTLKMLKNRVDFKRKPMPGLYQHVQRDVAAGKLIEIERVKGKGRGRPMTKYALANA